VVVPVLPFAPQISVPLTNTLDIKASNLMLTIEDEGMLREFEDAERESPCPRKVVNQQRTIYASREFRRPKNGAWGYPVLCDFGEARIGSSHPYEEIQPEIYKAPEILMQTEWTHSVDVWNAGCMVSLDAQNQ
jgi:serine/threonine protein kinase